MLLEEMGASERFCSIALGPGTRSMIVLSSPEQQPYLDPMQFIKL